MQYLQMLDIHGHKRCLLSFVDAVQCKLFVVVTGDRFILISISSQKAGFWHRLTSVHGIVAASNKKKGNACAQIIGGFALIKLHTVPWLASIRVQCRLRPMQKTAQTSFVNHIYVPRTELNNKILNRCRDIEASTGLMAVCTGNHN